MFKITSPDQHGAGSYMANQHDAYGVLMDMLVSSTTKGEKIWHLEQKIDGVWVLVVGGGAAGGARIVINKL